MAKTNSEMLAEVAQKAAFADAVVELVKAHGMVKRPRRRARRAEADLEEIDPPTSKRTRSPRRTRPRPEPAGGGTAE